MEIYAEDKMKKQHVLTVESMQNRIGCILFAGIMGFADFSFFFWLIKFSDINWDSLPCGIGGIFLYLLAIGLGLISIGLFFYSFSVGFDEEDKPKKKKKKVKA